MRHTGDAARRLLRGLLRRRWASLALLFTGALTIAAATLGPLYARAAQESVLNDRLTATPAVQTALHTFFPGDLSQAVTLQSAEREALPPRVLPPYPHRIEGLRADAVVYAPDSVELPQTTRVVARDEVCAHLRIVQGHCPTQPGQVLVSARTATGPYGYHVGGSLLTDTFPKPLGVFSPDEVPTPEPSQLSVVGVYQPLDPDEAYWLGVKYFNAALSYNDNKGDIIDAVFTDRSTFGTFGAAPGQVDFDFPLDASQVRLAGLSTLSAQVSDLLSRPAAGARYEDQLPQTLRTIAADRGKVEIGSVLVSLQLAALALFVLFIVTRDALAGRGDDVALAKLRGLTAGATVRFLLAEPLTLLVVAVPVGAVLGWLATRVLAALLLAPGVPVLFPGAAYVAAVAGFVGACAAALVASRRVLTRPVLEQWRGSERVVHASGRLVLTFEFVVAAAAVAGLVLLALGNRSNLALLAPGLLVLAVALLGIRLLPLLARLGVRRTDASTRLGPHLAVRQLARRPAALRLGVLLAVALGLAVFAVGGESVASGNRQARAQVEIGAPRTVTVQFAPQADPVALAHQVDPQGRWAMVAARWLPDGGNSVSGAVLGVDPSRLTSVAYPTTQGASLATIKAAIAPPSPATITLTGTTLRVSATASAVTGAAPYVSVVVQPPQKAAQSVRLGTLADGAHDYTGTIPCQAGCRLLGFGWERPVSTFDDMSGTVTVTGLADGDGTGDDQLTPVDLHLDQPAGWKPRSPDGTDRSAGGTVTVTPDGVQDAYTSSGGGSAGLGRFDQPLVLPVWAGAAAVVTPPPNDDGSPSPHRVLDANGVPFDFTVAGHSDAIPGSPRETVLGDVSALRDRLPSFTSEAVWSVWLGADAPADALDRLRAGGLQPGAVTSTSTRVERLGRQGPALALALLLACAIAAAVLATGATATAISATGRRRSFELAALRILGVTRRSLTQATILEQAALLGTGLVLGVPAGVVAAIVAMPVIPQFSDTSPLPLSNSPQALPIVLIGAAFLVLLLLTAVLAGVLLVRAAVPTRLRESSG